MTPVTGLYIHVPFCRGKCFYCDFYSVPQRGRGEAFVDAAVNELHERLSETALPVATVYIGGGTPSSLPDDQLRRLVDAIPLDSVDEFTIEVNPEDVCAERIAAWKSMGINRVSMGVQSLHDEILSRVGRRHTAARALAAFDLLRDNGVENVSLDLIYGLPGDTVAGWRDTLHRILELRPAHLSAYSLSYEQGTRLDAMRSMGKIVETSADECAEMYSILISDAAAAGYDHYEISNFALPGRRALHNSRYWDLTPYIGVGPGAHGWTGTVRYFNRPDLKEYLAGHGVGSRVIEEETEAELFNDVVFTALRTSYGLDLDLVRSTFGHSRADRLLEISHRRHIPRGNVILTGNRLVIPESRWILSNDIISDYMEV